MRSCSPLDLSRRCTRCLFPTGWCLCPAIPWVPTRSQFLLIRHASERWRTSNTGRWAALALPRARILEYACAGERFDESQLQGSDLRVLFPGAANGCGLAGAPRSTTLVVLDGTWQQARRMLQRLPALRALPRLSLPPPPSIDRLRRSTVPGGMSTLEAMGRSLEQLGEPAASAALLGLHAEAVRRARAIRGGAAWRPPDP